jgi:hypothetical protein
MYSLKARSRTSGSASSAIDSLTLSRSKLRRNARVGSSSPSGHRAISSSQVTTLIERCA